MLVLTALRTQIKWILAMFIIIFTASVAFMYGTGSSGGGSDSAHSGDFVVAKVNGTKLHISELQQNLRSYVERTNIRLTDENMPHIYKAVFDQMISNRAVLDEVERLKITAPLEDVNAQMKALEGQFVTKEAFFQQIRNQGQTIDQVKAEVARELAVQKMLTDAAGGVTVNDDEVKNLYEALRGNFTQPKGIEADFAHLKNKEAADTFVAALRTSGDWAAAVKDAGENVILSSEAGKPERVADHEMTGRLEPVAALADNGVTEPIQLTDDDYIVLRRVRAVEESTRPLSEVQDGLREMLLQSKRTEEQQKFINELTNKMEVEILTPDIFEVKAAPEAETAADLAAEQNQAEAPALAADEQKADTPAAEQNQAEAPAPAADEQKADAPVVEVNQAEDPAPAADKQEADAPAAEENQAEASAPAAEEQKADAPAVEQNQAEDPAEEKK